MRLKFPDDDFGLRLEDNVIMQKDGKSIKKKIDQVAKVSAKSIAPEIDEE